MSSAAKHVKVAAVGDGFVGKTSLLMAYATNTYPAEYVPTVFDNYMRNTEIGGQLCAVSLWDTAGQAEYDRIRPLSYPNTDVFLLCFSLTAKASYANVTHKWIPEIRHHSPDVPIVLVGTKLDARDGTLQTKKKITHVNPRREEADTVTYAQGIRLMKEVGASGYYECSARKFQRVNDVFNHAVQLVLDPPKRKIRKQRCKIM